LAKKLPEDLAALLTTEAVGALPVRIMFQDEARFGRMVRIRRCWSPAPSRPMVDNGYERQFTYVYGAVSPIEGELDWKISPHMNTEQMNQFLKQVSQAHREEFIVMVVDGASSHRSQELEIPENIRLHRLPGYSPELNPQEHIWDELREKEFPNRVFESMTGVVSQLEAGLPRMAANTQALRSLTAWPWIISLNLKAN
jgi:transposase